MVWCASREYPNMNDAERPRFKVTVKFPDETKEYLVIIWESPQDNAIRSPLVRAAEVIKLKFLVDVPPDQFVEISEAEMSKMVLRSVPSSRHDLSLFEILS
jgi:hypothetical protein